jgi:hypothetical protein
MSLAAEFNTLETSSAAVTNAYMYPTHPPNPDRMSRHRSTVSKTATALYAGQSKTALALDRGFETRGYIWKLPLIVSIHLLDIGQMLLILGKMILVGSWKDQYRIYHLTIPVSDNVVTESLKIWNW